MWHSALGCVVLVVHRLLVRERPKLRVMLRFWGPSLPSKRRNGWICEILQTTALHLCPVPETLGACLLGVVAEEETFDEGGLLSLADSQ